ISKGLLSNHALPDGRASDTSLLNLNLISECDQPIDRSAAWPTQENQIRTFLEKQDSLSFLIQIDTVDVAHSRSLAATQAESAAGEQPGAPRLKTRSVFKIQSDPFMFA